MYECRETDDDFLLVEKYTLQGEDEDIMVYDVEKTTPLCIIMTTNHNGFFHIFNLNEYLNQIGKSFSFSQSKIEKQIEIDFTRMHIYIGEERKTNTDEFMRYIKQQENTIQILCNQASFAYMVEYLYSIYCMKEDQQHLIHSKTGVAAIFIDSVHNIVELHTTFDIVNCKNDAVTIVANIFAMISISLENKIGILHWVIKFI